MCTPARALAAFHSDNVTDLVPQTRHNKVVQVCYEKSTGSRGRLIVVKLDSFDVKRFHGYMHRIVLAFVGNYATISCSVLINAPRMEHAFYHVALMRK